MENKGLSLAFLLILLLTLNLLNISVVSAEDSDPIEQWALIICGSYGVQDDYSFSNDCQYMYHVLSEHHYYDFNGIYYLDVYTDRYGVNALSTKANVRYAINTHLASLSDENDMVFIYFSSHGGGYNTIKNTLEGGRIDGSQGDVVDEGSEHFIDGSWKGVDECMQVQDGWYWDDELAADLSNVQGRIVFVRQGCVVGNQSCFGGGLIDDLSGPNRILMTASNETGYSYGDLDRWPNPGSGYSEWSERFMDALHGERTYCNYVTDEIIHTGEIVDADYDCNMYISFWEAWIHAWDNDEARYEVGHFPDVDETPWFDDDGDGLPTFINGADHFDEDGQGDLAKRTYLTKLCTLTITVSGGGTTDPLPPGNYTIEFSSEVTVYPIADAGYTFNYWLLDGVECGSDPTITVTMYSDHTLEAHFVKLVNLVVTVPQAPLEGVKVWVDGNASTAYANVPVSVTVTAGQHTIEAERGFIKEQWLPGHYYIYTFNCWSDGSKVNPRTMQITSDTTLTAHYVRSKYSTLRQEPE
jgi:hypothetical protein